MTRPEHFDFLIESAQPPAVPDSRPAVVAHLLDHANLPERACLLAIVPRPAAERSRTCRPRTMQEWLT